jgi:hypothetical protein
MPYSTSQPPPQTFYQPYSQPPHSQPPNPQPQPQPQPQANLNAEPTETNTPSLQIDPRLTAAATAAAAANESQANGTSTNEDNQPSNDAPAVTASQAPTITSMVHGAVPPNLAVEKSQSESEPDRQGSTSPGGTKRSAQAQDIPSEKLGFREDKRALSKLDRVFARV